MRAVDTNVVVRLIVRDNERQAAAAERIVRDGAWLSVLGLAETVWVLSSVYEFNAAGIVRAVEMLLQSDQLIIEHSAVVARALEVYRLHPRVRFSDCLLLEIARQSAVTPLATFDRNLAKIDGAELITS